MVYVWEVVLAAVGVLIGLGIGMCSLAPPDFKWARRGLLTAALLPTGTALVWIFITGADVKVRLIVIFSVSIYSAIALPAGQFFVAYRERLARPVTTGQGAIPPPPPAPPNLPAAPLSVDLRGALLEIYIGTFDEMFNMAKTYVVMKVHITNHGPDETMVTSVGLSISLPGWQTTGTIINAIPSDWRIRKPNENSFIVNSHHDEAIEPRITAIEVYKKGHRKDGWFAFELSLLASNLAFPNAKFDLCLVDSFNASHHVIRESAIYEKKGELIRLPSTPGAGGL